jgi:hypothetical protein
MAKVSAGLGLTRSAVYQWKRIPPDRVPAVSQITGIPRHKLSKLWQEPEADGHAEQDRAA